MKQKRRIEQLKPSNLKGKLNANTVEDYYKTFMDRITQVLSIVLLARTAIKLIYTITWLLLKVFSLNCGIGNGLSLQSLQCLQLLLSSISN